ncbi:MAG: hypothetical protein WC695_03795 [Candidatus Omnitrophota bacterium]
MDHKKIISGNRFEKHPVITIFLVVFFLIIIFDLIAGALYKIINGYSWNESLWVKSAVEKSYRVRSGLYHHDLAKNKLIPRAQYRNFKYKVCTNSLGFKDKTVRDVLPIPDTYRMLFIGDSFTEGIGFDYEDTFVGQIDRELSTRGIEVLNAAVCSYSPSIYWRKIKYLLEEAGVKFNEVVVFLDVSDITDEVMSYCMDEEGCIVAKDKSEYLDAADAFKGAPGPVNTAKRILTNIKLMAIDGSLFIYPGLTKLRAKFNAYGHRGFAMEYYWTIDRHAFDTYGQKGLLKASRYMDKLHELLEKHGIKLTVCVYPWPQQISYGDFNSKQDSFWSGWCKNKGVDFYSFYPQWINGKSQENREIFINTYYSQGDCHWNKKGHTLVAREFLEYFKDRSQK